MTMKNDWIDHIDRDIMPFVEYEGYENRYPAKEVTEITPEFANELRTVSSKLFKIFCKVTDVFQKCGDEFMESMEIPPKMRQFLRRKNALGTPTWLSRFDFVMDRDNKLHMVEINADTPCAIVEAYYANTIACRYNNLTDPNLGAYEGLKNWLKDMFLKAYKPVIDLHTGKFSAQKPFVFSCFHDYKEDYGNTMFLMNAMREAVGAMYPPHMIVFETFYNLRVDDNTGAIVLPDGREAGAIYRLHPMELLIEEVSEDGFELGTEMMTGYMNGEFEMFNPPEAIIMQSKGFQALVWALAHSEASKDLFTSDELETIECYLLPSYFERDFVDNDDKKWLNKPIWGREGCGITLRENGEEVYKREVECEEDIVCRHSATKMIQKYVEQPQRILETDEGRIEGYYTFSCFMQGYKPAAVYARFSPECIAGTEAYWAPLGYKTKTNLI